MALFGKKTTEKAEDTKVAEVPKAEKKPAVNLARSTDRDLSGVLIKPHITEKAVGLSGNNVYTFEVRQNATKYDVRDAVSQAFGVTPVKVNIVKKAPRKSLSRSRGRVIAEKGLKKAYVYLKDGDTINLV
jgi:large subunit ribosomal protein L23